MVAAPQVGDRLNAHRNRFNWHLPLYAAVGALMLFVPIYAIDIDIGMLYIFVAAPIVSLILLVLAIRKKELWGLPVLSIIVVYWAISWGLFKNSRELHTATRWLLWSKHYKAKVLTQPDSADGALKHTELDGWGFPGAGNTVVYLVFDPNDSLSTAARSHSPGKFSGIPCGVYRVRCLESHYYSVLFYTDTDWGHCD
jgi:hypothetical protein